MPTAKKWMTEAQKRQEVRERAVEAFRAYQGALLVCGVTGENLRRALRQVDELPETDQAMVRRDCHAVLEEYVPKRKRLAKWVRASEHQWRYMKKKAG